MEKKMEKENNIMKLVNYSFEVNYLNNKEWIGTRYDEEGNMLYKLNNNINGKGKEYDYNGQLLFEGEYLNGKGKEYYSDGH